MKVCRKCKSKNGLQARFCFQCGTRLSTTLAHSKLEMPAAHKLAVQTPLDLNDFIKHPLQKTSDVITSQNQGKQLSPKLQAEIQKIAPSGLNKIDETKSTPNVLSSSKVPLPVQLKRQTKSKLDGTPTKLKISQKTRVRKIEESPTQTSVLSRGEANENKSPELGTSNFKKSRLLSAEQRLRLSGQTESKEQLNSPSAGLRPTNKEFSLARLEQMEKQKRDKLDKENRRKQLRHDLAYLDQVFPNDINKPENETELSSSVSKLTSDSRNSLKLQIQRNEELTTSLASNLSVEKEVEAVEDIPNRQEPNPSRSKQWINTIGSEGPASPAERLSQSARLDSGEFITPFLTMAAFVYFCYVLYI